MSVSLLKPGIRSMASPLQPFRAATIVSLGIEAAIHAIPFALTSSSIQGPLWPCHFPSGLMESSAGADTSLFI